MLEKIKEILQKIPGFGICTIAAKELNLIKSQKIALALILLYPLIVVLTIAMAFAGSSGIQGIDVAIFINPDASDVDSNKFITELDKIEQISLVVKNSEEEVINSVKDRETRTGIVIQGREPTHKRFIIDIWNDNSDSISPELFFQLAQDSIRRIGFETSKEALLEIWSNLSQIKTNIEGEIERTKDFEKQLAESETEIKELKEKVNNIDINEMRSKLESQEQIINETEIKLQDFEKDIDTIDTTEDLNNIRSAKEEIDDYIEELEKVSNDIYSNCMVTIGDEAICGQIKAEMDKELNPVKADLEMAKTDLQSAENKLVSINSKLNNAKTDIREIKRDFDGANEDLNYFNSELSRIGKLVDEINDLTDEALETKVSVQEDLDESQEMMNNFISRIDELQSISPEFLSNPIILNKKNIFILDKLEISTPLALVMVLILTTILLTGVSFIVEKEQGAYERLVLTSTPKYKLILGKIVGQMVFALLESFIILGVAVFAFGVELASSWTDIFFMLIIISFSFIAIGLFITNYTRIQSTVILGGLILIIPMIFISGLIIPTELMNQFIADASGFQPLTLNLLIAKEIMLKGTPLTFLTDEIIQVVAPGIAFVIFTLINKRI